MLQGEGGAACPTKPASELPGMRGSTQRERASTGLACTEPFSPFRVPQSLNLIRTERLLKLLLEQGPAFSQGTNLPVIKQSFLPSICHPLKISSPMKYP